jgi:3-deoxy-D-manno-octulosonic-acid transferase
LTVLLFVYHFTWTIVAASLLPFLRMPTLKRLRRRLVSAVPAGEPRGKNIWIHALSVGEVISALPLVRALKNVYPSEEIFFTVTTSQGEEIARRELATYVEEIRVMPLDFWWATRRIIREIRPKLFLLIETDLWPGLLHFLKQRGTTTLLLNGRVSPRTLKSYRKAPMLVRRMYKNIDFCFMQTKLDRERLLQIGIEPQKLKVTGNVKFDHDWLSMTGEERLRLRRELHLLPGEKVWVAGSTHQGESSTVLDVFAKLLPRVPELRLIIAPRRLEEVFEICREADAKGLTPVLKTKISSRPTSYRVLIIDTMGELRKLYGIACVSFVGGSLLPFGGHNLLEPASFGCPVLFGPHTQDFDLMSELLIEAGGGIRVANQQELLAAVQDLLMNPQKRARVGEKAMSFVEANRGALKRVMDHLRVYIEK